MNVLSVVSTYVNRIGRVILLALVCLAVHPVFAATVVTIVTTGSPCPEGSKLAKPYSVTYINADVGEVTHVEHVDCDGNRTVGNPSSGKIMGYHAYSSFLYADNVPLLSAGLGSTIVVSLTVPAKIEVRDGYTGSLLAVYPSGGAEQSLYTVPSTVLAGYVGHLIVVDVIRSSDNSYRGTASVPYGV